MMAQPQIAKSNNFIYIGEHRVGIISDHMPYVYRVHKSLLPYCNDGILFLQECTQQKCKWGKP